MSKEKILIVEDDLDQLKGIAIRLKKSGYDIVTASDAYSAMTVYRSEEPDLIILDIGLPGGDGFTVMERLNGLMSTAPVIILSVCSAYSSSQKHLEIWMPTMKMHCRR